MDKQAFKQRMQNLKSYRENNPGKGYWDWRNSLPDNLKYTDDTEYNMRGAFISLLTRCYNASVTGFL